MRRLVIAVLVVPIVALVTWIGWIALRSYNRTPALLAALERDGAFAFSPSELPRARLRALLVVQDPTFYRHNGIGLVDGPLGHTTLTQALGKGLFFKIFTPGLLRYRKIELMIAAWAFDRRVPKTRQLQLYLNRAGFGSFEAHEILGFPAAARAFFGKDLQRLTDEDYLGLLAMLEAPNRYHVLRDARANAVRVHNIQQQVRHACGEGCFQGERPVPCVVPVAFQ
jgi:membrane carboxypeptidase/penicillin-binding protein